MHESDVYVIMKIYGQHNLNVFYLKLPMGGFGGIKIVSSTVTKPISLFS